jgi:hypothetical protein
MENTEEVSPSQVVGVNDETETATRKLSRGESFLAIGLIAWFIQMNFDPYMYE